MKKILVISGTSGSGKTTIKQYLMDKYHMAPLITHTTRPKRAGERDGQDYYFETKESFFQKKYLESVEYDGNFYGSSYEALQEAFKHSDWAVIVLDTKGALSYLEKLPTQTKVLYLTVKNEATLQQRLQKRGDTPKQIKQRLASYEAKRDAQLPQALAKQVFILENDDLQVTLKKLDKWIAQQT